jgi:putative ABC transport system ATP-binding protein
MKTGASTLKAGAVTLAVDVDSARTDHGPGAFALDVQRLVLRRGERVAVVGPSGCGKSTLVQLLAGILPVRAGRVAIDGTELGALSEAERRAFRLLRIGLVFQDLELVEYLDARDNILLPLRLAPGGRIDAAARERVVEIAERLGIGGLLGRRPGRLSGGERQRVAVARALVNEPVVCLADEPTGHLDRRNALAVLELLIEETQRRGTALVLVTHDRELLPRFERIVDAGAGLAELGAARPAEAAR